MSYTRLLLTWLLLAVLMPMNGALREFGFKKLMPVAAAEVLSVATGIFLILITTKLLFRIPASSEAKQLTIYAVILVGLTVAYEFGIGFAGGKSVAEMLENYAIWKGRLWPLVLVALAATPWVWRGR